MSFSQLVMCVHVVVMWCWCTETTALPVAPNETIELRDAKIEELSLLTTGNALATSSVSAKPEASLTLKHVVISTTDEDNWDEVDFLENLRGMMAMICPTESDRRTCKGSKPKDVTESITAAKTLWAHWKNLPETEIEDIEVKCGQLVDRINNQNVACVLHLYEANSNSGSPAPDPKRVF